MKPLIMKHNTFTLLNFLLFILFLVLSFRSNLRHSTTEESKCIFQHQGHTLPYCIKAGQ